MVINRQRGAIPVLILYLVGALAATQLVPNWRLPNLFKKAPPTADLTAAQADLKAKTLAAQQAETHYTAALADFQTKKTEELRYSQQMVAGIPSALKRAPASPEVALASSLAERASKGLSQAIGDLPTDRQAEIMQIVEGALSAKQAEIDAARATLALRDHDLAVTEAAKQVLEAQIPTLKHQVDAAETAKEAAQVIVTTKTAEVVAFADKASAKEKEAGSLSALVAQLEHWGIFIGVIYLFIHFALPSLAQEFPASKVIGLAYRWGTSLASSHKITPDENS